MDFLNPQQRLQFLQHLVDIQRNIAIFDAGLGQIIQARRRRRRPRARRLVWTRPWLLRRPIYGHYETLLAELNREDIPAFRNYTRMDPDMFYELVERLTPRIQKQDTWYRKALEPGLKVAITLRYLATGDSYHSLMYNFRVAHNTISYIVRDVCKSIIDEYAAEVISAPTTEAEWLQIAELFSTRWNFHNCLGAMDGKHIAIKCPKGGGSLYFNYKKFHSIVLMALVDADYKFIWIDVGANGSASDAQIFNSSELKECIENRQIGLPADAPIPNDDKDIPYFIIGDDAFPLRTWLMKPFSRRDMEMEERIFNYRLSRARRVSENAFGIMANRWRCLLKPQEQNPKIVESIVSACCCLHNLCRIRYPGNPPLDRDDGNHGLIPGDWRNNTDLTELQRLRGNVGTRQARKQRLYLKKYYSSEAGAVPWQNDMV